MDASPQMRTTSPLSTQASKNPFQDEKRIGNSPVARHPKRSTRSQIPRHASLTAILIPPRTQNHGEEAPHRYISPAGVTANNKVTTKSPSWIHGSRLRQPIDIMNRNRGLHATDYLFARILYATERRHDDNDASGLSVCLFGHLAPWA